MIKMNVFIYLSMVKMMDRSLIAIVKIVNTNFKKWNILLFVMIVI